MQVGGNDYPTHEEVRWWMRNHANFPFDFLKVREAYRRAQQKEGKAKDESDKRIHDTGTPR